MSFFTEDQDMKDMEMKESLDKSEIESKLSLRVEKAGKNLAPRNIKIKAVLLTNQGDIRELEIDDRSNSYTKVLGSRVRVYGFVESLNMLVIRTIDSQKRNSSLLNKFAFPFNGFRKDNYYGDYLLTKVDKEGNIADLTVEEYKRVSNNNWALVVPGTDTQPIGEYDVDEVTYLKNEIRKKVIIGFQDRLGRNPESGEFEASVNATFQSVIDSMTNRLSVDETEYYPALDETRFEYPKYVAESEDEIFENPSERLQYQDAVKNIQALAREQRDRILLKTQQELGVDYGDVLRAFNCVRKVVLPEDGTESEDTEGDEVVDSVDVKEFEKEFNEALEVIAEIGREDGKRLAISIAETFEELNGVPATEDDVRKVFNRIKSKFIQEADEEIFDTDSELDDEVEDDGSALYYQTYVLDGDITKATPEELVEFAKRVIKDDLKKQAEAIFVRDHGRKYDETLDKHELNKTVNELYENIDFNDQDDEDYDPKNEEDRKLEEDDLQEEYLFELENGYRNINTKILEASENKSFSLFSTKVVSSKITKSLTYNVYLNEVRKDIVDLNFDRAVSWFTKFNGRDPTDEEIDNMVSFLGLDKDLSTTLNQFEEDTYLLSDAENEDKEEEYDVNDEDKDVINKDLDDDEKYEYEVDKESKPLKDKKMLNTDIKYSKTKNASFSIYFEDPKDGNVLAGCSNKLQKAKIAYKMFNRINPTNEAESSLKKFIAAPSKKVLKSVNIDFDDEKEIIDVD